jgi:hypothetical protein
MESNQQRFPKLKGSSNYEIWSIRMEASICEKGYLDVMTPIELSQYHDEAIVKELLANRNDRSFRAAAIIRLSLEDGPLIQTRGINDALTLWERLKALYEPKGFSSEFLTCKDLFSTTLAKCGSSMEAYLTKVKRLTDDLASRNLAIPNKVIAAYTLNNLTPEYENTVAIISQTYRSETGDIDLIMLFSQLVDESRRIRAKEPIEMALNTAQKQPMVKKDAVKKDQPKCSYCHRKGHTEEKCWTKDPSLKPKQNLNKKVFNQNSEVSLISDEQALSAIGLTPESTWILDSAATSHICAYKDQFLTIQPCEKYLNWGKAQRIRVNYIGEISLKFSSTGQRVRLTNVLFVPELGVNLLSTGKLIGKEVTVTSTPKACYLTLPNGDVIAQGDYKGDMTLFYTDRTVKEEQAFISDLEPKTWHQRMGHIGTKALKQLPQVVEGLRAFNDKSFDYLPCETCIQSKATAIISRETPERATEYLEKVHSDICGPITPETWSKSRYFASFIDDKTRWAEISLLRTRDQLQDSVITWLKREENQSGLRLKRFHSDNAPEYKALVKDLFIKKGIIGTYSAPFNPEQNGTAEIFNRTIISKVRAMLITSGLPKAYWGEALTAAVYIYNRTPHSNLKGFITPYESRYGTKPDLSNIRIWGSLAYKKEALTKKLDPRADLYLITGYGSNQYKVIRPFNRKTQWARDVYPIEGKFLSDLSMVKDQLVKNQLADQLATDQLAESQMTKDQLAENPLIVDQLTEFKDWENSFMEELKYYAETALPAFNDEPFNYQEVLGSKDKEEWLLAMNKELEELNRQQTWSLTNLPTDRKALKGRWVLKLKQSFNQKPVYKARWVAKGFLQRPGIDFNETYANTVNPISYRLLLPLAAFNDWEIEQWDVKSAYPNASLTETVYIQQPIGFEDGTNRVCKLNKALYGLKQSAREWEQHFKGLAAKIGLKPLKTDQSVYISEEPLTDKVLILIAYVDDIIAISNSKETVKKAYEALSQHLVVKDLGPINTFLGIKVTRDRPNRSIRFNQKEYTQKILDRFGIKGTGKALTPIPLGVKLEPNPDQASPEDINKYQQEIGCIMYLMTKTRPDLALPTGLLARFMSNPSLEHQKWLKRLWLYIDYTKDLGLNFQSATVKDLIGYCDADWGGDIGTRRSTTGYLFLFRGAAIAWNSRLQRTVALSSCEAEYMALKEALKEQLFIKAIIHEIPWLNDMILNHSIIYTDSNSAIELAKNPLYHHRTKHIDIQYHFIRELVKDRITNLVFIPTDKQLADGLTKPLDLTKTQNLVKGLGLDRA